MNCIDILFERETLSLERPGIVYFDSIKALNNPQKNISFKDFGKMVGRAQNHLLKLNIECGDVALLFELPSPDLYAVITAMLGLGVKVLLVEPWLPVSEINHIIEKLKPKIFVRRLGGMLFSLKVSSIRKIPYQLTSTDFIRENKESKPFAVDVSGDHVGILTFTSGTTGKSKGVVRSHQYLINQREVIKKYIDYQNLEKLDLTVFTNLTLMNLVLGKGSLIIPQWKVKTIRDLNLLPEKYIPDTIASGPHFLNLLADNINPQKIQFDTVKVGGALSGVAEMENIKSKLKINQFFHIYGSTEAEPVAFCNMEESIQKSKNAGCFHCVFMGKQVSEIKIQNKETLWVSGPHVSKYYLEDELSNQKNKMKLNEDIYHNMGDIIKIDESEHLWFQGRDFQGKENFLLEQSIYQKIGSAEGFIHIVDGEKIFITSLPKNSLKTHNLAERVVYVRKIFKDRRHLSRIDRTKTIKKFKIK